MRHCIFGDVAFDLCQTAEIIEAGTHDSVNSFHGLLTIEKHTEVTDNVIGLQNDIVYSDSLITS